jgi:nucleoside-diphosphate-sugar epimerase
MNKTSLVAGAAGFLGSALSASLLARGHRVIGLDNFSTSEPDSIDPLLKNERFSFVEGSVSDSKSLLNVGNLDYVFHLASPASPPKYQALGLETLHANTIGTENLIAIALETKSKFLFASTSEIYGDPLVSPQAESYWGNVNTIGPRSIYDESKRLGETLVSHFVRNDGLNASIVRIFNTYGPGMDPFDGRVVSTFIRQALLGQPFTIFGDGLQTRSFCFVDDLIRGIIQVSEFDDNLPFNLGNPDEITLISLAATVAEQLSVDAEFTNLPLPEDDPRQRKPDISRAKKLLGWEPTVTLDVGIRQTAKWMKDTKGIG